MIDAILIGTDNRVSVTEMQPELHALQSAVGGSIEAVFSATGDTTLWINEDGKSQALPENRVGTWLWWHLNPAACGRDVLFGPVVITGGADHDGGTCGVGQEAFTALGELRRIVGGNAKAAS